MDYYQKALEFYEKSLKEKDEFTAFLFKYISFEISYKAKYKKIDGVMKDSDLITIFFRKINIKKLEELKFELDKNPHINVGNPKDKKWAGKLDSPDDFSGIVQFLRRARNNLFHGDKGISNERDLFIVTFGNIILNPLLESLLKINC